jgi:hypothetical protein
MYSSWVQQPMRATAILGRHLHTRQAALFDPEQERAGSLHPEGQRFEPPSSAARISPTLRQAVAIRRRATRGGVVNRMRHRHGDDDADDDRRDDIDDHDDSNEPYPIADLS